VRKRNEEEERFNREAIAAHEFTFIAFCVMIWAIWIDDTMPEPLKDAVIFGSYGALIVILIKGCLSRLGRD
jgi:DMSO/TMAO reductase YedYZ heme-binding membrane subunit